MHPLRIASDLSKVVAPMRFSAPVTHVYNPLEYARAPHEVYLRRFAVQPREVLLVGMNPGPWGMAQTGVPFGDVEIVRDWMGIEAPVGKPKNVHPKRSIQGFDCTRSEVSGTRLWGWARDTFGAPEKFFEIFFVANYCPLCFMEASGRNYTPDKLPARELKPLLEACDEALQRLVSHLAPAYVIGVGAFAEKRIRLALPDYGGIIGRVLHPSPASPKANRGWSCAAEAELRELGVRW